MTSNTVHKIRETKIPMFDRTKSWMKNKKDKVKRKIPSENRDRNTQLKRTLIQNPGEKKSGSKVSTNVDKSRRRPFSSLYCVIYSEVKTHKSQTLSYIQITEDGLNFV